MKKLTIIVTRNPADSMKETPEERKERIRTQATYTRWVQSKKTYNRQKYKRNEWFD